MNIVPGSTYYHKKPQEPKEADSQDDLNLAKNQVGDGEEIKDDALPT